MSSHKVIQDIEAEDKLVGPLTLRQFIYAGISSVCLYICFLSLTKNAAFLLVFFLPIAAVAGFFAFPWKGEQPTEIWALARLRFMIKPRVRVWNQSGVKDVVTITAPRTLETRRPLTNNLSENEVRSRLKALASTIDSRGWATRNASFNIYGQQGSGMGTVYGGGIVMTPGQSLPVLGANGVPASDDMFDEHSNVSQNFAVMLDKSSQDQRQRVLAQIAQAQQPQLPQANPQQYISPQTIQAGPLPQPFIPAPQSVISPQLPAPVMPMQNVLAPTIAPPSLLANTPPSDYWFAGENSSAAANPVAVAPPDNTVKLPELYAAAISSGKIMADVPVATAVEPTADENAFAVVARQQNQALQQVNYSHMRVLQPATTPSISGMIDYGRPQPVDDQMQYDNSRSIALRSPENPAKIAAEPVTHKPDPVILELANNDDLDVATIARRASKEMQKTAAEVEIRLH